MKVKKSVQLSSPLSVARMFVAHVLCISRDNELSFVLCVGKQILSVSMIQM